MSNLLPDDNGPDLSHDTDHALYDSITLAIRENDQSTLLRLLKECKKNPVPIPPNQRGETILHVAVRKPEYKDCLELLLRYNDNILFDIDAKTIYDETALYIACLKDCHENVEILLRYGCNPYTKSSHGFTPLFVAVERNHLKIIKSLLKYPESVNQPADSGWTPLHRTVRHGRLGMSRILLEKGADVRLKDRSHCLPLHLACERYDFDIARLLVQSDPTTINCPNIKGITPFMIVACCRDENNVRFLLNNGAKIEMCDNQGKMALHFAAERGHDEVLRLLLQSIDASIIEECLSNIIPRVLNENHEMFSLTCAAIGSKSVKCLEILLSSKLSKSILQTPYVENDYDSDLCVIYSPLAYLLEKIPIDGLLMESYLPLLLEHKITMLDEFFEKFPINWPQCDLDFVHPFSGVVSDAQSSYEQQELCLNLLNSNNINIDYCLQNYCTDSSQLFATFFDYQGYYAPLDTVISDKKVEILKLFMSTSVILEPDIVSDVCNPLLDIRANSRNEMIQKLEEYREIIQYLISLKPVYFTGFQLRLPDSQTDLPRFPYSTIEEEFSCCNLQQLCRTVIRHHVRDRTIKENLRNFKRKIMELPLPSLLKDYLLFKK